MNFDKYHKKKFWQNGRSLLRMDKRTQRRWRKAFIKEIT